MPKLSRLVTMISIAAGIAVAMPVFAESAPVYDADSMSQSFDNTDSGQDLPPPPPPGQEGGGAFVPVQSSNGQPTNIQPVMSGSSSNGNLEMRVKRLEQTVNNSQGPEAASHLESLQTQLQTLRGQVEQLTHQLELLQNQQKSLAIDVDKRLSQQAATAKQPAAPVDQGATASVDAGAATKAAHKAKVAPKAIATDTSATANQPNVAEEQQIYQTAYNLIKAKKYSEAVTALQSMLQKYPSGQFAANAHYWLGELYGLMNKHDQALTEFNTVVNTYPESPRVSDAQLKVGLILASQLKWSDAKAAFKKVINHYPGTGSARLASEQLKQIKQAGH